MNTKVEKKFFSLADFEEELEFLNKHHQEGWRLVSFDGKYHFEECTPQEYCYQLDFNPEEKEEEVYIQMFADCGWEFICKYREWYYFRKAGSCSNETGIFSDKDSKLEMCNKILKRQSAIAIPIFLIISVWDYFLFFTDILRGDSLWNTVSMIIGSILMIAVLFVLGIIIGNTLKLNKMVSELSNPIRKFEDK